MSDAQAMRSDPLWLWMHGVHVGCPVSDLCLQPTYVRMN